MRFEHWYRCNFNFRDQYADFLKEGKTYPCTSLFYETKYACSDDMLEYLLELGHTRMANEYHPKDYVSLDVKTSPTIFDSVDQKTERRNYTY